MIIRLSGSPIAQTPVAPPLRQLATALTGDYIAESSNDVFHRLPTGDEDEETLEEATRRISVKYDAMERMAPQLVGGRIPSLIISGPPGMGKSRTMDEALRKSGKLRHDGETPLQMLNQDESDNASNWYDHISGSCSAPGLYRSLWHMRHGGVLLIDDCDQVFKDGQAIDLMKIATDSSKKRVLSWRKQASWLGMMDRTFEFNGHLAFLTNLDFEILIKKYNKDTEHFKALLDRARYLCLTLRTQRDFMIRIRQVALDQGLLAKDYNLNEEQSVMLVNYIEHNKYRFYNLSLRLVGQIAQQVAVDPHNWQQDIEATKMRTGL